MRKEAEFSEAEKEEIEFEFNLGDVFLTLNFDLLTVKILRKKDENLVKIMVMGSEKCYEVLFENKSVCEKFCFLIMTAVYRSDGYKKNLMGVCLRTPKFADRLFISLQEFESTAKTGDLLLFKSRQCLSKTQRFYTRDEYDHIALIKNHYSFLALYEATSLGKCNVVYWENFKYNLLNLAYEVVAYRKLNYENEDEEERKRVVGEMNVACGEFIDCTKNMQYYISLCDMMCKSKPKDYQLKNEWEKSKGFCCSSLVAAAYIKMGVMKPVYDVHSSFPGDFESDRNRFVFNEGFSLGPEKIIEFSTNG